MPNDSEIKNQLKITTTIYYSLIIGLIFFFVVSILVIQNKNTEAEMEVDKFFTVLVPVFGFLMMFISKMLNNKMLTKQGAETDLLQKIVYYRTVKIISWAMVESACILALVALMVTSNYFYCIVFIFLIGYFYMLRPSKESFVRDLRLKSDESDIILRS